MQEVKTKRRYRLTRSAAGPVSFIEHDQQLSTNGRATVCASTYRTMLRLGWNLEVL